MDEYEHIKAMKDEIVARERAKIFAEGERAGRAAEREACAKIADAEPEFPGEPDQKQYALMVAFPVAAVRAAFRAAKKRIAAAIRSRGEDNA